MAVPAIALPGPLTPHARGSIAFVGRSSERSALGDDWKKVVAEGHRHVSLISGEPGVGKTRLAAEVAALAHDDGGIVVFGRCDDDLALPFQPWVEAITALVNGASDIDVARWCTTFGGDLGRLVSAIADRVPDLPPALRAEPDTERLRLFEAVVAFFSAVSETAPALFVLDDLHWADKGSLLLLRHLVRSTTPLRMLVIGTYRDTDLDRAHPLADVLADLRSERGVDRVSLEGLSATEVEGFVEAASGDQLSADRTALAREIYAETEGNPFFVGQVLGHLLETGAHNAIGIPEGVREVIGRRLDHLPAAANEVLAVAAVIGREFDIDLVAEVAATDEDDLLDVLDQAETAHLVAPVEGRPNRLAFVHALVRTTLYDELLTTRRLRLHRRIGEVLEARAGESPSDGTLVDLARHFGEAAALGEIDRAVDYARRAAASATARLAHDEALVLLERALAAIDVDDAASLRPRCELLVDIADAADRSGGWNVAATASADAFALAIALDDDDLVIACALGGHGRYGSGAAGVVNRPLVARLEAALDRVPESDTVERALVESRLAVALYWDLTRAERRRALAESATARARRLDAPATLAEALLAEAYIAIGLPGFDARAGREIAAIGRELGNTEMELQGLESACAGATFCGDLAEAEELLAQMEPLVDLLGQVRHRWYVLVRRAALHLAAGRLDAAEECADAGRATGAGDPGTSMQIHGIVHLELRRLRGGIDEMLPLMLAMLEQHPAVPAWRTATMFVLAELDRHDELREHYDALAATGFDLPADTISLVSLALCAKACFELDDQTNADLLTTRLLPYADCNVVAPPVAYMLGSTHHFLALLAATRRDWDAWERHIAEAVTRNEAMGAVPWTATAKYDAARSLLRREQTAEHAARARLWLDEAEAAFILCNATHMADKTRRARSAW